MDMNAPPGAPPPPSLPPPPSPPSATPPPPPRPPGAHRRLGRDRSNAILGGVCAGVAETYGIDVTLVRVLWVIAGVMWIGVPAYIVAWIALAPADGRIESGRRFRDPGMLVGLALVAIGVMIASNRLLPHGFRFDHFGAPLLLIGGGLAILFLRRRDDETAERDDAGAVVAANEPAAPVPARDITAGPTGEVPAPTAVVPPSAWTQTAPWPAP